MPDGPPRYGALNIYSTRAHGLDTVDRSIALLLASVALARAWDVSSARLETTQLTAALQSRASSGRSRGS